MDTAIKGVECDLRVILVGRRDQDGVDPSIQKLLVAAKCLVAATFQLTPHIRRRVRDANTLIEPLQPAQVRDVLDLAYQSGPHHADSYSLFPIHAGYLSCAVSVVLQLGRRGPPRRPISASSRLKSSPPAMTCSTSSRLISLRRYVPRLRPRLRSVNRSATV